MIFAVVDYLQEQGCVACFLRYHKTSAGLKKLSTEQANQLIKKNYPGYFFFSKSRDSWFHGVPFEKVEKHYQPRQRLQYLLSNREDEDGLVTKDLIELCACFNNHGCDLSNVGVTGSILIDCQHGASDIDLVIYRRASFIRWQMVIQSLISGGLVKSLNQAQWRDTYQRRGCEINFEQYLWHEQRKNNKGIINDRKFDLSLVEQNSLFELQHYQKRGAMTLVAKVAEDTYAFDYPSVYVLDHPEVKQAVSYTATYSGQAKKGEMIKIVGQLEIDESGLKRIVVGSDREAKGEYIVTK